MEGNTIMSKAPINFNSINTDSLGYLQNFADARIAIAKEDQRHKEVLKPLRAKLDTIHQNRETDLAQGLSLDDVLQKHSTVETEKAIRQENELHRDILKPLNSTLKDTYVFMPDGMYDAYVRKIEQGKRGNFIDCIRQFLENIGIEEVSQSALGKLSERMSDHLGVSISNSKKLLEEQLFASTMGVSQFNKLFMSIFCDILAQNAIIKVSI